MVRDSTTGERVENYNRTTPEARRRAKVWSGELPEDYEFDLELLPGPGAYQVLQDVQRRAAGQGVTVTAELQKITQFPVDRQLHGVVAIMPPDERDQRDFAGKPLMVFDDRGLVPQLYVGNGAMHLGAIMDKLDERHHYGEVVPNLRDYGPAEDVEGDFRRWQEQARDHRVKRKRYGYHKRDGLAEGVEWIGE